MIPRLEAAIVQEAFGLGTVSSMRKLLVQFHIFLNIDSLL